MRILYPSTYIDLALSAMSHWHALNEKPELVAKPNSGVLQI
jgi:hypothetical protein